MSNNVFTVVIPLMLKTGDDKFILLSIIVVVVVI